ncbi:MAG: hypothetical protein AUJ12_09910 [Alphaproteobacteria bacterium CG1_02_46_17]|nr:MAG: hypothetical protein AUJ12_09910 [Alphaproteobacteria bacterium CG1_02_46_17]
MKNVAYRKLKKLYESLLFFYEDSTINTSLLTRGYVLALSLIIILTLLSHYITSRVVERGIVAAEISFDIGYEVSLVGQIERYATSYYTNKEEFDRTFMVNSIEKLKGVNGRLYSYYADDSRLKSPATDQLKEAMQSSAAPLEEILKDFIAASEFFLTYTSDSSSPQRQMALKQIVDLSQNKIINRLQNALTDFQQSQVEDINTISSMQRNMTIAIILLILLEALFIFRPLVKRIEEAHANLTRQALEDPLTGLKNRRAFSSDLIAHHSSAVREKKKFVLAVCDLDKFKTVNDTYGHDVGDLVLKHFSEILRKALRPSDVIARMGGEEFVILLTNTDAKKAHVVLDRLRLVAEKEACPYKEDGEDKQLSFTTSIGYAEGPLSDQENVEHYIKLADSALYKAKEGGRNIVVRAYQDK